VRCNNGVPYAAQVKAESSRRREGDYAVVHEICRDEKNTIESSLPLLNQMNQFLNQTNPFSPVIAVW
jgi:hypothetical protein